MPEGQATMSLDEKVFRAHLERGPFQSGVDRGRWRLITVDWPHAVIAVRAAERVNGPAEYSFRFLLNDYPQTPPTAQPWKAEQGAALNFAHWPGGRSRVPLAFNPGWKNGVCLYLPCDREAIIGHDPWRTQHPEMIWSPAGDITQYLRIVYDLLNSEDYTGCRQA
jgi:hypothetical protein